MSAEILARIQFALTTAFHYIFPPLSIGLGMILVVMEGLYLKTKKEEYKHMTRFWVKIFGLIFGIGVATGIVLEFEFGTNWASYSRFVGDIFGSALAAEGIFAFFLESGFLAILVFGWHRVSHKVHFLSTIMVALGSTFSAVWIIVANSWMQTPAGYRLEGTSLEARARITDFWAMVFNPSTVDRLSHTVMGAWATGAFFVMSVSAYYLLKGRHTEIAKTSMKIGIVFACIATLMSAFTGHNSASGVARNQPSKFAALEGHAKTGPADLVLIGTVDPKTGEANGLKVPGGTSMLLSGNPNTSVQGFDQIPQELRPPIAPTFYLFRVMLISGVTLLGLALLAAFQWRTGKLWTNKWLLQSLVFAAALPHIANQSGWFAAEIGRQPWIVYGMLKTSDGLSKVVHANLILSSIIMFSLVYALLAALFVYLLNKKIQEGPQNEAGPSSTPPQTLTARRVP